MGSTVHARDFFKQPFSEPEMRALLAQTPPADAFAWNSPRARAMNLSRNDPPRSDELVRLMLETPYLIRRPIIRIGDRTRFGPSQAQLESLAGR